MSEKSGLKLIKNFLAKLKALLFSKDALSFLLFLVLSASFWFVHTLDRERESTISLPVVYTGIPEDIQIINNLPEKIKITIRDEGVKLLKYNDNKITPLTIDLTRVYFSKGTILITPDQLKGNISRYVLPTTAVLNIDPDTILVKYQKLTTKILPVKLNSNLHLKEQYILSDNIRMEPSEVKVFGPKNLIDSMKMVYTDRVELSDIADTVFLKTKLHTIKGIKYSVQNIDVGIFVEMFTEKKQQISVTIINSPAKVNIRVFPMMIDVTYNVGLSKFNKIKPNDILVVFDYNEVKNSMRRKYKLRVINNSPYISNLRILPEEVEFLLDTK